MLMIHGEKLGRFVSLKNIQFDTSRIVLLFVFAFVINNARASASPTLSTHYLLDHNVDTIQEHNVITKKIERSNIRAGRNRLKTELGGKLIIQEAPEKSSSNILRPLERKNLRTSIIEQPLFENKVKLLAKSKTPSHIEEGIKAAPLNSMIPTTTLSEYIETLPESLARRDNGGAKEEHIGLRELVIFYWNSSGTLELMSPILGNRRLAPSNVQLMFQYTKPSKYGRMAMLFNSDLLHWVNWNVLPPVPMMAYTIPNSIDTANESISTMFQIVPNPYDYTGINEIAINSVQNALRTANLSSAPVTSNSLHEADQNEIEDPVTLSFDQFQQRQSLIVWRGLVRSDHIRKQFMFLAQNQHQPQLHTKPVDDYDEWDRSMNITTWLDAADSDGKSSSKLSMEEMSVNYKYQIDIGGVSGTTWGGLRWKMCASGGLVYKVDTWSQDWWHTKLVPWKHYVPVNSNFSDLYEMYQWAEQNPYEAYKIAVAGQKQCLRTSTKRDAHRHMKDIIMNTIPPLSSHQLKREFKTWILPHYYQQYDDDSDIDDEQSEIVKP